jgi:hypothetical protein
LPIIYSLFDLSKIILQKFDKIVYFAHNAPIEQLSYASKQKRLKDSVNGLRFVVG